MEENRKYYSAITKIAWGYIFIYVHINLHTIDILPSFLGYAMILYALTHLKDKCKNIMLLRPLAIVLIIWNLFLWIMSSFFGGFSLLHINIIAIIIEMYFTFSLFTQLSFLAAEYQSEEQHIDRMLIRIRNIYTVDATLINLINLAPQLSSKIITSDAYSYYIIFSTVIMLITALILVISLFSLRRLFKENCSAKETEIPIIEENPTQ